MRRGIGWKVLSFYFILTTLNATFDCGMFINFFINGPKTMRKLMQLNPGESFSPI